MITTSYAIPISTENCTSPSLCLPFSCCDPQGRQERDMKSSHPLWLLLQPGRWRKSWHLNRQCAVSRIKIVSASCLSRKHHGPPSSQLSPLQNLKLNFQSALPLLIQNRSRLSFVTLKHQMTIQIKQEKCYGSLAKRSPK